MEYEEKFTDSKQKFLHSDNSSNTIYGEKIVQSKLFNFNFFRSRGLVEPQIPSKVENVILSSSKN